MEDAIYLVDACPFERGERVEMDMVLAANKVLEDDDVSLTVGGRVAKQPEDHPRGRTRIEFGKLDEDAEDLIGRFSISYKYIPFGPFLSLGGAAMALYGEAVTRFLREDYPNWLRSL